MPDDFNIEDLDKFNDLTYAQLEKIKKHLDARKTEKEIRKLEIDIEKKEGLVIPTDLVKSVFIRHNKNIINSFKDEIDNIVVLLTGKYKLNANEVAEINRELLDTINTGVEKAAKETKKQLITIVNEFSEVRGKGEKK